MQSKSNELADKKIELPVDGERLADRYTIIKRVNLGGFGAVYRAIQDNLGRECALKVLLPDVGSGNVDYVEQFRQEALLTSQLRHPNTITIFDYGQTESGLLFLVMEWLDGKTLTDLIKEGGALQYERCFNISHQILKSLSEAHERGMVHRDLKPSNLFICTQYGEPDFVKVLDFGLVKNLTDETLRLRGKAVEAPRFTEKRRAPGTPHYMAPEQAMGKGTTTSADIYAFGLILHEMLTGKRAVDGADKMEVLLRQARQPVPALPEEFRDTFLGKVVERCVEKDPLKRPQTATVLLRDYQHTEEVRGGVEMSNSEVEAQAKWRALAEPKLSHSEVSSSLKDIFVGRSDELDEFSAIVKKGVAEKRGTTIVVTGQTGIGKTQLILKYTDYFVEYTKGVLISGVCLPQSYLSYAPIRLAIKKFLQIQSDDASDAQIQIKRALQKYRIQDNFLLNFLTHFIVGKYGQAGEEREETEMRVEEFFDLLSRQLPVLLVVENLHWADANTLNLLWKLTHASVSKQRPFFIVSSFRYMALADNRELQMLTERFNRLDHAYYREMQLGWLGKKDCNLIIDNAIKMQRAMANQCLNLSRGNPLFLNLVLRYILDEKSTNTGDDAQKFVIPNSIEKITLKRIDQVVRKYQQTEYKEILRRAALMGETFSISSVEALLRKDGQYGLLDYTSRALEVWRREGILRRQWEADLTFEFIHPYIVEYFNDDSSPELHLNVARTKEALAESDVFIDREDIARHFKLAKDRAQALRYLDFAANSAMQSTNLLKAKSIYEEMLPLIGDETNAALARRIHFQLGELSLRLSEFGPSHDYFTRTITLADANNDMHLKGLAYCGLAELALAQNQLEEANSNYNRAKTCLPEEDTAVQGKLLLGMGRLSTLKADWQAAMACFQKAYDYSSNATDFDLMAHALTELGKIYLSIGVLRQAHECFLAAQKNYQTISNSADEASLLLHLSKTFYIFMRSDDAHAAIERALEIFQRLGDQLGVANALAAMASLNAHLLIFDEAQKFVLRAIPIFKEYNSKQGDARAKYILSVIELYHGQYENAQTLADQALRVFKKTANFSQEINLLLRCGLIALYQNKLDVAAQTFEEAEMLLDVNNSNANRSHLLCNKGLLAESRSDFAAAESCYKKAQEIAQAMEYIEEAYLARVQLIKINVYFQPGRWYYDDLLEIINESRAYGLRKSQLSALLIMVWFEGVWGDQHSWENLMGELVRFVQIQRLPVQGSLRQFEFNTEILRFVNAEVAQSLRRSAGWIRQSLTAP